VFRRRAPLTHPTVARVQGGSGRQSAWPDESSDPAEPQVLPKRMVLDDREPSGTGWRKAWDAGLDLVGAVGESDGESFRDERPITGLGP
jgi:hypothetical protein